MKKSVAIFKKSLYSCLSSVRDSLSFDWFSKFSLLLMLLGLSFTGVSELRAQEAGGDPEEVEVTFLVNRGAEDEVYAKITRLQGETIQNMPAEDPVYEGHAFRNWVNAANGEVVTEATVVTEAMTVRAVFENVVTFVVERNGTLKTHATITRALGETVQSLPQDPFMEGYAFRNWVDTETGEVVTDETVVDHNMTAKAVFDEIHIYTISVEYYYRDCHANKDVVIDEASYLIENFRIKEDQPFSITSPAQTEVPTNVRLCTAGATSNTFYPEQQTLFITREDLDGAVNYELKKRVKYVPATAVFSYVYMLKDLEGDGYTQFDSENNIPGALHSMVMATVKNYEFAEYESTTPTEITMPLGQKVPVYYTRKKFILSYNTMGGTPINPVTKLYGTEVTVTSSKPTRTGYTFDGWYLDEAYTQKAGTTVTLNSDVTLYAKWKGKSVNYTIVYLFEKYNSEGTETSFVYDNSETRQAAVGSTVTATDAGIPDKTRKGWEKDVVRNATSSVEVKADGSAVLYVYYRLVTYTIRFNAGKYRVEGWISYTDCDVYATMPDYGVTNQRGLLSYSMTVKLGQDISSSWPMNVTGYFSYRGDYYEPSFYGWAHPTNNTNYVTKRITVTEDLLPQSGTSITYTANWVFANYTIAVEYWLEDADGNYQIDERLSQEFSSQTQTTNLSAKDIDGYVPIDGTPSGYPSTGYECPQIFEEDDNGGYVMDDAKSVPNVTYQEYNGHFYRARQGETEKCTDGEDEYYYNGSFQSRKKYGNGYIYVKDNSRSLEQYGVYYQPYNGNYYRLRCPEYTIDYGKQRYSIPDCRQTYRFYYNRNTYSITYYDGSAILDTKSDIRFGANINTSTYNYVPSHPEGKEDYTWCGWKKDSKLTADYMFGVMPSNDLALYACWQAPQYTVTFNYNYEGASEPFNAQTVDKYMAAEDPGVPSRAHYEFDGWYTESTGGDRYVVGSQVTEDISLYAHWRLLPLEYTVRYLEKGSNASLATDKVVRSAALLHGQTITEQALTIAGYIPEVSEISINLDYTNNLIVFYYETKPIMNYYKVRYVLRDDPEVEVHEPTDWIEVDGSTVVVTEKAASVDKEWMRTHGATANMLAEDFYAENTTLTLQLGNNVNQVEGQNVITFYYALYKCMILNIHYLDMCGNPIPGREDTKVAVKLGATYKFETTLSNFTYYRYENEYTGAASSNKSYKVPKTISDDHVVEEINLYFKKNLIVTAVNKEKVYDGKVLKSSGVGDVTLIGLEEGHTLTSIAYTGSVTNVAQSPAKTTPKSAVVNGDGYCANYYKFTYRSGLLTLTPLDVTVNINADRWNDGPCYDGTERTIGFRNNGAEIKFSNSVYKLMHGDEYTAQAAEISLTKKDAGPSDNDYKYILPITESMFTIPDDPNYNVTVSCRDGELRICPAELTVRVQDTFKYNFVDAVDPDYRILLTGLVNGETEEDANIICSFTREPGEDVGTYLVTPSGSDRQGNYMITYEPGTLTILDGTEPLYNIIKISNTYYRLAKTTILAKNTAEGYVAKYNIPDGQQYILSPNEYVAPDYDFESLTITISGKKYVYRPNGFVPEAGSAERYYTVTLNTVGAFGHKIGGMNGSTPRWIVPVEQQYSDPNNITCFHRDFNGELHDIYKKVSLYNFLNVEGTYYRLKKTEITAPPLSYMNEGVVDKEHYEYVCSPLENNYNFNNIVVNYDGTEYIHKSSTYVPTDLLFVPYYTTEFVDVTVNDKMHDDATWYANSEGWLDTEKTWGVSNNTKAYHGNYKATLHKPEYIGVTLVANSAEYDYNGQYQTISGYKVYLGNEELVGVEFEGVEASARRNTVGVSNVTIKGYTLRNTKDKSGIYVIEKVTNGTLKINPIDVTVSITGKNSVVTYNVQEHKVTS